MVGGKGGSNLVQFAQLINRLIEETRDLPLPEMVEHMLEASGLNAHYKAEREGAERLENLNELITAAAVFASEENYDGMPAGVVPQTDASSTLMPGVVDAPIVAPDGMTPLAAFLSHAALEAGDNQAQQGQDAVQLMTVHAAKGLEFDAVFITGLEEGLFPHENSILEQSGLEEERRLMYVAITRARQPVHHAGAEPHAAWTDALRHAFALPGRNPEKHLKWLTPKAGLAQAGASQASWGGSRTDAFGRKPTNTIAPRQPRGVATGVTVGDKQYRVGQGVHHARFGDGTIIGLSGSGQDAQAEIQFRDVGAKTLALGIAKLDIVQG